MKKYKVLVNVNDDGLILKKGSVYIGIKKDDGNLLLWVNGKPVSFPYMITPGTAGFEETNSTLSESKRTLAIGFSCGLILGVTVTAVALKDKIGLPAVMGAISGAILSAALAVFFINTNED